MNNLGLRQHRNFSDADILSATTVGGYGPAQSYFTYKSFDAREALDYVLFVYFGGDDLHQLARRGLLDLDDDGRLRQREARGSPGGCRSPRSCI